MKCFILMTLFLMTLFLMASMAMIHVPAYARAQASATLPITARVISYTDSKQICCFSHDSNSWCWQMASHLWISNGTVFDDRNESVPREAGHCNAYKAWEVLQ